jgi:hypothetical protein
MSTRPGSSNPPIHPQVHSHDSGKVRLLTGLRLHGLLRCFPPRRILEELCVDCRAGEVDVADDAAADEDVLYG